MIGEGPNVTVQQSAIGTLDVGGAGAANSKLIGENLRGNLGASHAPPAVGTTPAAPNAGITNFSFQTPNFGSDLQGAAPGRAPTKQELRVAEELILPRYRAKTGNSTLADRFDPAGRRMALSVLQRSVVVLALERYLGVLEW